MRKRRMWAVLVLVAATGCATIQKDGFTLDKNGWERVSGMIAARAAFDFQCPKEQLTLTVLAEYAAQVAAAGCGKRGVYVNTRSGYVLNSNSDAEPSR